MIDTWLRGIPYVLGIILVTLAVVGVATLINKLPSHVRHALMITALVLLLVIGWPYWVGYMLQAK